MGHSPCKFIQDLYIIEMYRSELSFCCRKFHFHTATSGRKL